MNGLRGLEILAILLVECMLEELFSLNMLFESQKPKFSLVYDYMFFAFLSCGTNSA